MLEVWQVNWYFPTIFDGDSHSVCISSKIRSMFFLIWSKKKLCVTELHYLLSKWTVLREKKKKKSTANSVSAKKRHGWSLAFDQLPATRLEHNFMGISWKDNSCSDVSARLREMLADCWQKSCLWFCTRVSSDLYKPLQGVIIQSRLFAVNINCFYYFNYIRQCFLWDFVMRFSAH